MECVECNQKVGKRKHSVLDIHICTECTELPKYKLICKTQAMTDYFIKADDLINCKSYTVSRGKYPNMILYHLSDIINVFKFKYNTDDINQKLDELKAAKKQRIHTRDNKKLERMNARKQSLITELHKKGLELRDDSNLCRGYINGDIKMNINSVVERMCQMKYLYEYCKFVKCYQEAFDKRAETLKAGYIPDCTVFDEAESLALHKYGPYPDIWPWLN
jgi:hypothetical protein